METIRTYKEKTFLGKVNNERIYLYRPSWDCNWYWGFGYLGNRNCHYHVSGLMEQKNLYNGLKEHFGDSFVVKNDNDIWTLAELFATFYTSRKASDMLHRGGGSNYTNNPLKDIIKNEAEYNRINSEILPALFDEIYKILEKY